MEPYNTCLVEFGTPGYDETVQLRDDILRKPLGLEFTIEDLSTEFQDIHLACYLSDFDLIGCLVLRPVDEELVKMRQVAVKESMQKKGVGQKLVQSSEAIASNLGFKKITLSARHKAIPFYKKLGYKKVGKSFKEVGIKHYKMEKKLPISSAENN